MYFRSSGEIAMNLMPIPNTALASMSQLSDYTNLAITGIDFAPGGLRIMVKLCPRSGSMGEMIQAPSTLISFVLPVIVPWEVLMKAYHLTWILGWSRVSISITV
jgi:uncharacterized membrane protein HdeD (DUF308 family)